MTHVHTQFGADRKHPDSQTCFYSTTVFRFFVQEFKLCFSPQSSGALPVHICLCGRAALCSVGLLLHQTITPSPLLTPWTLTFIERMVRKGEIVWFLSFPLSTKGYKHRGQANENLVNSNLKSPRLSQWMTCLNLVLYKQAHTRTHTRTFKLFSRVYLSFESHQKSPRQIVSLRPMAEAVPNNSL